MYTYLRILTISYLFFLLFSPSFMEVRLTNKNQKKLTNCQLRLTMIFYFIFWLRHAACGILVP